MEDPQDKVEGNPEPEPESVSIPKERLEKLQRLEASEGYRSRKLENELEGLKAKYQELMDSQEPAAEGEDAAKSKVFSEMKRVHKERQDLARERAEDEAIKLENTALRLSREYGVDAAELAGLTSGPEMENKALKLAFTQKATTARGIDTGTGGSGSGQTDAQITAEYIANPTAANRAKFEKVRERGGWA